MLFWTYKGRLEPLQTRIKKNKRGLGAEKGNEKVVKAPKIETQKEHVSICLYPSVELFQFLYQNYLKSSGLYVYICILFG